MPSAATAVFDPFLAVGKRAGTIVAVSDYPEARRPSYIGMVDLRPVIGVRKSVAQITGIIPPTT